MLINKHTNLLMLETNFIRYTIRVKHQVINNGKKLSDFTLQYV